MRRPSPLFAPLPDSLAVEPRGSRRSAIMASMVVRHGKQQMREVRGLLMEWDVLGIADVPQCADEYDCMIGPLLSRLHEGADAAELHQWITREVADHFGLTPNGAANQELADVLVSWWGRRQEAASW